jgi:beta-xylosidase
MFAFVFGACTWSAHTPTDLETLFENATLIALPTTTPTATATAMGTSPSPETMAEDSQIIFRDDFDSFLSSKWIVINENKAAWSLENEPGFLEITALRGYFNLGNAVNVFLQSTPSGDFVAETRLIFIPRTSDEFAGLIAVDVNGNFLQAGVGYCPIFVGCSGRGLNIDLYLDNKLTLPRNTIDISSEQIFIQFISKGNSLEVVASLDRYSWQRMFSTDTIADIEFIGLIAAQNNSGRSVSALFDYFEISTVTP